MASVQENGESKPSPASLLNGTSTEFQENGVVAENGSGDSLLENAKDSVVVEKAASTPEKAASPPEKDSTTPEKTMITQENAEDLITPENIKASVTPAKEDPPMENSESELSTAPKAASPISTAKITPAELSEMRHHVKWIHLSGISNNAGGSMTPIVTQNENGPCPLLALVNVLFLRGQAKLDSGVQTVSSKQLLHILRDCINRMTPEQLSGQADYQRNVNDALESMEKLMHGIDVNVKFTGIDQFEYTPDFLVFDLLNIPLHHGWLVEPERGSLADLVSQYSYNQLIEFIIAAKSGNDQDIASASAAEDFLEATASQLTYRGICELNSTLKDGALCVFFRNNHFSTMLKHQDELFLLVTDQGFLHEPRVVWESLNSVDGDSRFVDMEFHTVPPKAVPVPAIEGAAPLPEGASAQEQLDHDLMVALSLEEQDRARENGAAVDDVIDGDGTESPEERDRRLALKLQDEENKLAAQEQRQGSPAGAAASNQGRPNSPSAATGDRGNNKKDKCTII